MSQFICQFKCIPDLAQGTSARVMTIERLRKILLNTKRAVTYLEHSFGSRNPRLTTPNLGAIEAGRREIAVGDMVRVRSQEEIRNMLDFRGIYKGCPFLREQFSHCGKSYQVLKEVHSFYDEVKDKICKCKNMILLEGAFCQGRQRLYSEPCDMNCYFFWHKDWVEKI